MNTYRELIAAGSPTRAAATLVGVPRATTTRKLRIQTPAIRRSPSNRLTDAERALVLGVVSSKRFIDLGQIQILAQHLDEGTFLCSVSTLYRILK
jgi:putative transposase